MPAREYPRLVGRAGPLPCPSAVLKCDDETKLGPLPGALRPRCLLFAGSSAAATPACNKMRSWLHQGGGSASSLLVVDAETGRTLCASAAARPRSLASNMKLFTTSTAITRLGPTARIPTKVFADGQDRPARRPPRQPLPAGRRRPGARHADLLQRLLRRPGHQRLRARAADPRRPGSAPSPGASTPTTRSSTGCGASPTPAMRPARKSAHSPASPSTPATAAAAATAASPRTRRSWRRPRPRPLPAPQRDQDPDQGGAAKDARAGPSASPSSAPRR